MCTNHASSCCACCAPGDQPAPPCVRTVSGTVSWPPDMKRCFAAWLTICSVESVRKSSYMISTTGRMPCIAAPMPAPTIAISEIGVLRTRSGPNSSTRSEERRVGKECRSLCDWSSDVCSSDLDDGAHALHRGADARTDDRHLGDRGVAHALRAELVDEIGRASCRERV